MTITFSNIGAHLATRATGASIREKISEAIDNSEKVVLDFSGVETISNSFADECFAKLIFEFDFENIKENARFKNASPFVKSVIADAFVDRLSEVTKQTVPA